MNPDQNKTAMDRNNTFLNQNKKVLGQNKKALNQNKKVLDQMMKEEIRHYSHIMTICALQPEITTLVTADSIFVEVLGIDKWDLEEVVAFQQLLGEPRPLG
jgi:hypothetical protein